jgi:hypothetical protein
MLCWLGVAGELMFLERWYPILCLCDIVDERGFELVEEDLNVELVENRLFM